MIWILNTLLVLRVMATEIPRQDIQADAYNLHQVLNYMYVYTSGKCEVALDLAKKHLGEIKEKPGDKPLGKITAELWKYKKPSNKDVTDLEFLRLRYVEILEKNSIEHKMAWHREIRAVCPTAPPVE